MQVAPMGKAVVEPLQRVLTVQAPSEEAKAPSEDEIPPSEEALSEERDSRS